MSTRITKPRKNGCNLQKLPEQQLVFVHELSADLNFNGTAAARKAGYKQPSVAACKLLRNPRVQAALGKVLRERLERCELKADDILEYLTIAIFHEPLKYFTPAKDGGWLIEDPQSLPPEIGRLIEDMELKVWEDRDGNRARMYKVRLVSKTIMVGLAMKHLGLLVDKKEVKRVDTNWEPLYASREGEIGAVEQKILDVGK